MPWLTWWETVQGIQATRRDLRSMTLHHPSNLVLSSLSPSKGNTVLPPFLRESFLVLSIPRYLSIGEAPFCPLNWVGLGLHTGLICPREVPLPCYFERCSGCWVQLPPYAALNIKHLTVILLELTDLNRLKSEQDPLITVTAKKRKKLAFSLWTELKERQKGFYQCLHSYNKWRN